MGLSGGAIQLATFVAIRAFDGPDVVAPLIVVASQLPWLFAPALDHLLRSFESRRTFIYLGVAGKLPLFFVGLLGVHPLGGQTGWSLTLVLFLTVIVLHNVVYGLYIAHRGALLRANYATDLRGRWFGWFEVAAGLTTLLSGNLIGYGLDQTEWGARIAYPLCGLAGILASFAFARIAWRREPGTPAAADADENRSIASELFGFWRRAFRLLRSDGPFRRYEIGFMFYGVGFLSSVPLVAVLSEGELGLSYGDWARAQSGAFPVAYMLGVVFFGRLSDRLGPVRISGIAFTLLAVFFVMMTMATGGTYLTAAFLVWGLAMSGVSVGWMLGPLWFAPPGQARRYSSAHVFLVGARSVVGPPLGFLVAKATSLQVAFGMSAAFVLVGALVLLSVKRPRKTTWEGIPLPAGSGVPATPTT